VNYCAECQTGGKVLADRGMSRLLKEDWPRSIDEWEGRMGGGR
jgi:formamidopyrimidine-DNA glycosylase